MRYEHTEINWTTEYADGTDTTRERLKEMDDMTRYGWRLVAASFETEDGGPGWTYVYRRRLPWLRLLICKLGMHVYATERQVHCQWCHKIKVTS